MLAMESSANNSSAFAPSSSQIDTSKEVFSVLQPLCSRLFELPMMRRAQSNLDTSLLVTLRQALHDVPLQGLQDCTEYVLFPLQLLLDASVESRSKIALKAKNSMQAGLRPAEGSLKSSEFHISDQIAEGVLGCIQELLLRCPVTRSSQLSVLLRKLTTAAMLSADEASEEFRHAAVNCLKTLLSGLQSCGRSFCGCKLSALPNSIISNDGSLKVDIVSTLSFLSHNRSEEQREGDFMEDKSHDGCVIGFLQSERMSAAVGHLSSLFLQVSENEALKGRIGSANIRIDAIMALRILLLKVGAANSLAFFLPGIASRLVKSLQITKRLNPGLSELSYPSGAAGSSGAADQAVRAFSELLMLVLADERNRAVLEGSSSRNVQHGWTTNTAGNMSVEAALATLWQKSNDLQECRNASLNEASNEGKIASEMAMDSHTVENISADSEIPKSFHVERTKSWMDFTLKQIRTLLNLCFPALCCHPAPSVRLAVVESAALLMSTCQMTLESFIPILLESLLAMACDDLPHVASASHAFLSSLTVQQDERSMVLKGVKSSLRKIISRLLERLPKAMYSGDASACAFLSRQLLAAMFFAGPHVVSECIFHSTAATSGFISAVTQCLSFNVLFLGSIQQLHTTHKTSAGIIEFDEEAVGQPWKKGLLTEACVNVNSELSLLEEPPPMTATQDSILHQLPRLPPWFRQSGGCKFYAELASIARLVGLSSMLGSGSSKNLFVLIEELVTPLRCMPTDLQNYMYRDQFPGQWQRAAAASIAVLNEVFFGASGLWIKHAPSVLFALLNHHSRVTESTEGMADHIKVGDGKAMVGCNTLSTRYSWEDLALGLSHRSLVDHVGTVLHEFTSDALWKLPTDTTLNVPNEVLPGQLHVLQDNSFLQQVILESIGVTAVSIGKLFEEQGFLVSTLYLLLERLGCADHFVSSTACLVIQIVSSACGYPSVRSLIMTSTDYIVDSLCRQLRHLDFFPTSPNMLVAVLRYTDAGQDLVPLLQEPMRSISLELEITARQVNPKNTFLMLRALSEIVIAAKGESARMLEAALLQENSASEECSRLPVDGKNMSHWDKTRSEVKERERSRQALQEIVMSCLNSSSPLMASKDQRQCLLALEVTEFGMAAMACLDAVAKVEKEKKVKARTLMGQDADLSDFTDAEPPKLLPTMNHVWPHLAACLKHTVPSVLIRASQVIASVVSSCGGDFFTRRFQKDTVPRFLTILCQGTGIQSRSDIYGGRKLVSLQGTGASNYKDFAPASLLKVQEAVLACIANVAKTKKTASALARSLEQLAGLVVCLACGSADLENSATQTLISLSNIDSDLIWILLADIAYTTDEERSVELESPGPMFPHLSELLPPFLGSKEALWMQFCSKEITLNTNSSKALSILSLLESGKDCKDL